MTVCLAVRRRLTTAACLVAGRVASVLQAWSASLYAKEMRLRDGESSDYEEHLNATPRKKGWQGFRNVSDNASVE